MRLSKQQKYIAEAMLWAVDSDYFCYGTIVDYLPRSDKFRVICGDLDNPVYYRLGKFYHEFLELDKETQEQILTEYEACDKLYRVRDTDSDIDGFLDYFGNEYKTYALAYKEAIRLMSEGFRVEIDLWHNFDCDIATDLIRKRG